MDGMQQSTAVAYYACASVGMTLVNKAAVKTLPHPYFLCFVQNAATLFIALCLAHLVAPKFPSAATKLSIKVQLTAAVFKAWLPALLLFVTMLISSLSAMEFLSVPSVLVFRA